MNGRRVGFSGSSVRRLTPVRGFYYDVLGFPGYKRYIGASTYIAASSFLPTPSLLQSFIYRRPSNRGERNACSILVCRFSRFYREGVVDLNDTRRETRISLVFFSPSFLLWCGKFDIDSRLFLGSCL